MTLALVIIAKQGSDSFWPCFILMVAMFGAGYLMGRSDGRKKAAQVLSTADFNRRLSSPKWEMVEARFGRPAPDALKRWYLDPDKVLREDWVYVDPASGQETDLSIAFFTPIDEMLEDAGPNNLVFANNGAGDLFYIPLDQCTDTACPVMVFEHETNKRIRVSDSLEQFLESLELDEHA